MLHKVNNQKGFTLIELMIVVAIVGILAAIAIPNFLTYQAKAAQSEARVNLGAIFTNETAWLGDPASGGNYGADFAQLGWMPTGQTRFTYAVNGGGGAVAYTAATNTWAVVAGTMELTNARGAAIAYAAQPGCASAANTAGPPPTFDAVALGNVDNDATLDCWVMDETRTLNNGQNDVNL